MATWVRERLGAVRMATLPAGNVARYRLETAPALAARLDGSEDGLRGVRLRLMDDVARAVGGCEDRALRRWLLGVKRDLHNHRPIAGALPAGVPRGLRARLERLRAAEAEWRELASAFEARFACEDEAVADRVLADGADPLFSLGLLLASPALAAAVQRPGARPRPPSSRDRRRLATVARYLTRAATRTTPFGTFAGVEVVPVDGDPGSGEPELRCRPQLGVSHLDRWLAHRLRPERLPLRAAPLRRSSGGELTVPCSPSCASTRPAAAWSVDRQATLPLGGAVRACLDPGGRSEDELVAVLAADEEEKSTWRQLTGGLVRAGFLQRVQPRIRPDPPGLRRLAAEVHPMDGPTAALLRELAGALERSTERAGLEALLVRLAGEPGGGAGEPPVYHDLRVRGLAVRDTGLEVERLDDDLAPVLRLAGSCVDGTRHRLMVNAIASRLGEGTCCDDVPGLLVDLLRDRGLVAAVRTANAPAPWLESPLGLRVRSATAGDVELDADLFASLPAPAAPASVALFLQASGTGREHRLVLNGAQSGRHKYLSRYLRDGDTAAEAARASLARPGGPVLVELAPTLGLNFQVHPPLTTHALQLPFEADPDHPQILPLEDLRLSCRRGVLRLWSRRLGAEVELVHLGFLRDVGLPDELLLLRALSPRCGEESVAERMDLYNSLDWIDLVRGAGLAPFRGRLTVGRVVVERARWAVPLHEVPRRGRTEPPSRHCRRLWRWQTEQRLPRCSFARRLSPRRLAGSAAASRFYLDWHSPFAGEWLGLDREDGAAGDDWLVMTELLPSPHEALLRRGGTGRAAEVVVQYELPAPHA